MARISGVNLPQDKRIEIALTYLYGIGRNLSGRILAACVVDKNIRVKDLPATQENKIREYIEKHHKIEGDLRTEVITNIKRLKDINCYRGTRHKKGLPARGQSTKTNSRTVRGNVRRTAGSGKKPSAEKT